MKRLIILFALLVSPTLFGQLITLKGVANGTGVISTTPAAAAGCSGSTILTNNAYASANIRLGDDSSRVYQATWFVPSSNMTVVTIAPYIRGLTTSPAYNFRAAIYYSNANTNPASINGSWSSYMPGNYVSLTGWSYTNMPGNICATLTNGGIYFVVLNSDAVDANGILWGYNNTVLPQRGCQVDADGVGTWSVISDQGMFGFRLLGGP